MKIKFIKLLMSFVLLIGVAKASGYELLDFDFIAPVVSNTSAVPLQAGSIVYQVGVGYKGVNSDGTFDDLSVTGANQVSSDGAGERIERMSMDVACSSNPCSMANVSQSGAWIDDIEWNGTGNYTINIASGMFSAPPVCVCQNTDAGNGVTSSDPAPTTSSFKVITSNTSGAGFNATFGCMCMGPR